MAFTVEDGTGLEDSNSFASLDGADTYFEDRGNATWAAASDDDKEAALIRATDYINNRFRFIGLKYSEDQALEFPRVYENSDEAEMPVKLLYATYEYAVRALSSALAPDPTVQENGLPLLSERSKVGPIEEAFSYRAGSGIAIWKPYPAADILLRDLIVSSKRVIR